MPGESGVPRETGSLQFPLCWLVHVCTIFNRVAVWGLERDYIQFVVDEELKIIPPVAFRLSFNDDSTRLECRIRNLERARIFPPTPPLF